MGAGGSGRRPWISCDAADRLDPGDPAKRSDSSSDREFPSSVARAARRLETSDIRRCLGALAPRGQMRLLRAWGQICRPRLQATPPGRPPSAVRRQRPVIG
eukprot:1126461-Pyramimonas_sp.AAC.1